MIALPQLTGDKATRSLYGLERSVHERSRRDGRVLFGGIADPKHRLAADRLAGNAPVGEDLTRGNFKPTSRRDPDLSRLRGER